MPADTVLATGAALEAEAPPELAGWAGAATAVHAIQRMAVPMTLRLHVAGHDVITIDFAGNAFEWSGSLADFPEAPDSVLVETRTALPDAPPFDLPGRLLDPLLFSMGLHAFGEKPASWLAPGDRFRLRRWPSLSGIPVGLDQVRMIAMLGNAFATADELAAAAHVPVADAQRLINALGVTGILRRSRSVGPPAADSSGNATRERAASAGLFSRLRAKWGR